MNTDKYKIINKILVGVLLLTAIITGLSEPVNATSLKDKFDATIKSEPEIETTSEIQPETSSVSIPDISEHWGKASIERLISLNAISGYPDGTFKPNNTITKAEFLKIAYATVTNKQTEAAQQGEHWVTGVRDAAIEDGIISEAELKISELNDPITRYEMTRIMVRLTENSLKEAKTGTTGIANVMSDYQSVSKQPAFKHYVEQAYMKGLIAGMDKQGTFAGDKTGTRAEAATMIVRIIDKSARVQVDVSTPKQGVGTEISATDPSRPLVPKAGDVFVKKDGTKVTLEIGPSGVLGEGQGVDYYSGITFENGYTFKDGDIGVPEMGHKGEIYSVDKTGEGHFSADWNKIKNAHLTEARKIENPKDGMMYGKWCLYETHGSISQWYWIGPVTQ